VDEGRFSLTRSVAFHATHRYHRPDWDDAKNLAAFGACAAPVPHGHDYSCAITVTGPLDRETGMVIDLALLDRLVADEVTGPLHGRLLNDALPECGPGGAIPTCETVAGLIGARLAAALRRAGASARVASVRLAEDDTLSATWTAP